MGLCLNPFILALGLVADAVFMRESSLALTVQFALFIAPSPLIPGGEQLANTAMAPISKIVTLFMPLSRERR